MRKDERQVSPTIDGIRRDHVARYEWAANKIQPGSRVIDFACGIGYGSKILADAGNVVKGFDIEPEAIAYGKKHYPHERVALAVMDGGQAVNIEPADVAVSFETIEHLEDPMPFLKSIKAQILVASVPNEAVMPFSPAPGITTAYHFRHYHQIEFHHLLAQCGWQVEEWYGQEGPESEVKPGCDGCRTIIAVARRVEAPMEEETEKAPEHVAIVGLGPSCDQYLELTKRMGGRKKLCDETWVINALGDVFQCDLIFHMDDVRIQEIRAAAKPESNIAAMCQWLKTSKTPIVTSRAHPDYPALVEFPLEDVLNHLGHDYFNSTAAYAVAFAIHIGVKKISLFGIDFTYPNQSDAEKGRACVEYWLGMARAKGIEISIPNVSTLMDANVLPQARLYGYDTVDIEIEPQADGQVRLQTKPRETLPTAEQIEANYDHSKPIAQQHQSLKE